jgi:dihydrodipicolinate synthase/N-acetylneuraminate lyase
MDRHSVDWRGYLPAITTPFDRAGELDEAALGELVEWLVAQGMHGLVLAGTSGEWFSLTLEEKGRLFRTAAKHAAGRLPLVAGCTAFTPREVIEAAHLAHAAGMSGILVTPPPYVVPSDDEIVAFYSAVSEASPLPVCVYNWPPGTNVDMSLSVLEQIARLDKVVAIKNSTSNLTRFCESFFALKELVRIFGVVTDEIGLSLVQYHGLDGMMGAGGVLGRDHPGVFEAVWRGDLPTARKLLAGERRTIQEWFKPDLTGRFGSAQAILKEALNAQGLPGGHVRSPILPVSPDGARAIRRTLRDLGKRVDDAA